MVRTKRTRTRTSSVKNIKPDAILCSDLHLREDQPLCRTDDYWEVQWGKVRWLRKMSMRYDCPVLCAGDIFHHWKPSPYLIRMAVEFLPKKMVSIPGQHDLPQHNLNLFNKCGLSVLQEVNHHTVVSKNEGVPIASLHNLFTVAAYPFGTIPKHDVRAWPTRGERSIAMIHELAYQKKPWPDAPPEGSVFWLMKRLGGFDLIVAGDNHKPFVIEHKGRLFVNPGSMMRMAADQIDHKPRVYLWFAETNEAEPLYYPIEKGVVSREHIDSKQERNERMEAFIARLRKDVDMDLDFRENMRKFLSGKNKQEVPEEVASIVWEALEDETK